MRLLRLENHAYRRSRRDKMVYPDSIVQLMDVNAQEVAEKEITLLFGKYISKAKTDADGIMEVEFDSDKNVVKVTDWKGWTDLRLFRRQSDITVWVKLTTKHGKSIVATPSALIMVYDPTLTHKGFHGETKYAYTITPFENVKADDIVRVRHTLNGMDFDIDFDIIEKIEYLKTEPKIGYQITTKSGFYNCNDFYLYGELLSSGPTTITDTSADTDFIKQLRQQAASVLGVPSVLLNTNDPLIPPKYPKFWK